MKKLALLSALAVVAVAATPSIAGVYIGVQVGPPVPPPVFVQTQVSRVWVAPVTQTTYQNVWHEPVTDTSGPPTWVPDRYEARDVATAGPDGRTVMFRQNVIVEPGHWRPSVVVVRPGYWAPEPQTTVLVPGRWETVSSQAYVSGPAYYDRPVYARPVYDRGDRGDRYRR